MSEAQIEFVHQSHKNIKDRGRQKLCRGGGSGHGCSGRRQLSLAAGGPLVEPEAATILLVPIAPHALSARPLVLDAEHKITLSIGGRRRGGNVTVDGASSTSLGRSDRVEIEDARAPLTLVNTSGRSFYDALRQKLGWRGRPRWGVSADDAWEEQPKSGPA